MNYLVNNNRLIANDCNMNGIIAHNCALTINVVTNRLATAKAQRKNTTYEK